MDTWETAEEMLDAFRRMVESFFPGTVAVPVCMVGDGWNDSDIRTLYWEMCCIAIEYARDMKWVEAPKVDLEQEDHQIEC